MKILLVIALASFVTAIPMSPASIDSACPKIVNNGAPSGIGRPSQSIIGYLRALLTPSIRNGK